MIYDLKRRHHLLTSMQHIDNLHTTQWIPDNLTVTRIPATPGQCVDLFREPFPSGLVVQRNGEACHRTGVVAQTLPQAPPGAQVLLERSAMNHARENFKKRKDSRGQAISNSGTTYTPGIIGQDEFGVNVPGVAKQGTDYFCKELLPPVSRLVTSRLRLLVGKYFESPLLTPERQHWGGGSLAALAGVDAWADQRALFAQGELTQDPDNLMEGVASLAVPFDDPYDTRRHCDGSNAGECEIDAATAEEQGILGCSAGLSAPVLMNLHDPDSDCIPAPATVVVSDTGKQTYEGDDGSWVLARSAFLGYFREHLSSYLRKRAEARAAQAEG